MLIKYLNISNLDLLYEYSKSSMSLKSDYILDKITIMMDITNVTAIEVLALRKISRYLRVTGDNVTDTSYIKNTYGFDENFISSIEDNKNLFKYIEKDEELKFDYVYETIAGHEFNVTVILNQDILDYYGSRLSSIFKNNIENADSFSKSNLSHFLSSNMNIIKDNFVQVFSQFFYSSLESDFNKNDEDVDNLLNRRYYEKMTPLRTSIVEAITPNGGYINFLPEYLDESDNMIKDFINYAKTSKDMKYSDEIEVRFICNTSFYSYFVLCGIYGLKNDCTITTGLLDNSLYIHDDILEKYQVRLDKSFAPLLSERNYNVDRTIAGRLLTSTFNSTLTYTLTVKLKDIPLINEIIDKYSSYDTDLTSHLENIRFSLNNIRGTVG